MALGIRIVAPPGAGGNFAAGGDRCRPLVVWPHVRGEYFEGGMIYWWPVGSPSRAWGMLGHDRPVRHVLRFTPTRGEYSGVGIAR